MEEHEPERPSVDQPLHGTPRPRITPILAVVGLVIAVVVLFGIITLVRYYGS